MMPWKTFLARAGAASGLFGLAMFAAIRLATADPGGPTAPMLTYAGVMRDVATARMATLTFTFTKPGAAPCTVEVRDVPIAAGGAFTAGVSIASCPTYFDGSNVTYTVAEGRDILTPDGGVAITPVPYARFADQAGVNNDCPAGYELFVDASAPAGSVVCRQRLVGWTLTSDPYDVVVRVGRGASAFWIDRYEATVTQDLNGAGRRFGEAEDWGDSFPPNAQSRVGRFARSLRGVIPTRFISWFQANETCRESGKRLPTGDEWLHAAQLTPDPNVGVDGTRGDRRCNTAGPSVRRTGDATASGSADACVSRWGAEDMIGNAWEWTSEWYAGAGQDIALDLSGVRQVDGGVAPSLSQRVDTAGMQSWPPGFGDDGTWNVSARTNRRSSEGASGVPSAAIRGGGYGERTPSLTGVFALNLVIGPSHIDPAVGFRCVIPR